MRRRSITRACLQGVFPRAALLLALTAVAATPAAAAVPRADQDNDRVLDTLEERLAGKPSDERTRVIVRLRDPATSDRVADVERSVGGFDRGRRFAIIPAFAATVTKGQVERLARDPRVVGVEDDAIARAANHSARDAFGVSEARIDAPSLDGNADGNAAVFSSGDLVAAVIDSGIDAGHRDLDEGKVIAFRDYVNGLTTPYDDEGHGTHVSGTIAGDGDAIPGAPHQGVAPGAALVGVKVLDENGDGIESNIIAAVDWVVANRVTYGIEAINLSLRIPGCSNGGDALSTAVNNAKAVGLVVVVAAGNEGPGTCTIGSPSAATQALTVGAMADFVSDGFAQAYFSSRGPTQDGRIKPDVSAPGVGILSAQAGTLVGYTSSDGTSMAAPFVTGVALLMRHANPALTSQQVKDKITQTAIDWARGGNNRTAGTTGPDIDYGHGRLDAYAAIQSAGAPISSPPLPPGHELREGTMSGTGAQVDYPIAITDTTFPIAATLIIPALSSGTSNNPDFDLFLLDPNGVQVDASPFDTRQEEVGYKPPITGTYTVRVRSARGSGGFIVDLSIPKPGFAYARPGGATPLRLPLVPAFAACTSPNSNHVGPLSEPSCSPPALESPLLTTSTTGRGQGSARLDVLAGNPATQGDEADVRISATATDVKRTAGGADHTGKVALVTTLRMTDRSNGFFANDSGTAADLSFGVPINCAATADTTLGATCSVSTTADTIVPGFAKEGRRAVIAALSVRLDDPGADASFGPTSACPPTCGTGDEHPFLRQGVFAP